MLEEFSKLASGGLSLEDVVEWLETVIDRAVMEVCGVCACVCKHSKYIHTYLCTYVDT